MLKLNKIYQGDCLELMKQIPDKSIDLIIIDPPYNIKKDDWDDIKNYDDWIKSIFIELQRTLKDNGSFYFFHSEMEVIADLMIFIKEKTNFIFRQFIVWNKRFEGSPKKGFLDGYVVVEGLRNYQQMAEYCLYYTFQDETGLSKIMGSCVRPIREYIREEIIRAKGKINLKEVNKVLGTATNGGGVASACLSLDKEEPVMITEEHYLKIREWLNSGREYEYLRREYEYLRREYEDLRREYEDLRREYEDLRREYEDLRFTFNNQKKHHSVWNYDIEKKQGHITPKPVSLIKNIILHSSKEGQIILDCFMGSGTTAVACIQTNRNFIGIELSEEYCKIANKRIEQKTLEVKSGCDANDDGIPPNTKVSGILPTIL